MFHLRQLKTRVKNWLGPLWWYTGMMFCVQRVGDVISIYIGLWLVPRWVSQSELGAILPLTQIGALLGMPLAVVLGPFGKFINTFAVKGEMGKVKALLLDVVVVTGLASVGVAGYTYLVTPFIFERLRVGGVSLLWLLCGLAITSALTPLFSSALQALRQFRIIAAGGLIGAPIRLLLLWLLLPSLGIVGFFCAQLLIALIGIAIAVWGLWHVLTPAVSRTSYRAHFREIGLYTLPMLALTVVGSLQSTTEIFVIRHFLPDVESAAYYMVSRFAEMPGCMAGALIIPFFPYVSERHESGLDTSRMLAGAVAGSLIVGGLLALMLTWSADWMLGLRAEWRVYHSYSWLMGLLSVRCVLLIPVALLTVHEMACRRFGFCLVVMTLQLLESGLLYGMAGIGFFQPYLPSSWWRWLSTINAGHLEFVVGMMFAYVVVTLIYLLVHLQVRIRGSGSRFKTHGPIVGLNFH